MLLVLIIGTEEVLRAAPAADPARAASQSLSQSVTVEELVQDPFRMEVPSAHAVLREAHRGTNGKLLIHIQDAHANAGAQKNLAAALDHLMKRYGLKLVLAEGSSRDATLTAVRQGIPAPLLKQSAGRLLFDGMIAGPEYLNLTGDRPMRIIGIEDAELYDRDLEAYAELAVDREKMLTFLHRLRSSLDRAKNKLYPADLIAYEKMRTGNIRDSGFLAGLQALEEIVRKEGFEPGEFPELEKLRAVLRTQDGIDFTRADKDAEERSRYEAYLRQFAALDLSRVLSELDRFENAVYALRLGAGDAGMLRAIDRYAGLLDRAYRIQMSADEYALYLGNKADFTPGAWQGFLNGKLAELGYFGDVVPKEPGLEASAALLESFYTWIGRRDEAFMKNAARVMADEGESAAFLVAGGYHTAHLTELMRKEGYSYVVLSPVVTDETDHAKYEEVLLAPVRHARKMAEQESFRLAQKAAEENRHTLSALLAAEPGARARFEEYLSRRSGPASAGARLIVSRILKLSTFEAEPLLDPSGSRTARPGLFKEIEIADFLEPAAILELVRNMKRDFSDVSIEAIVGNEILDLDNEETLVRSDFDLTDSVSLIFRRGTAARRREAAEFLASSLGGEVKRALNVSIGRTRVILPDHQAEPEPKGLHLLPSSVLSAKVIGPFKRRGLKTLWIRNGGTIVNGFSVLEVQSLGAQSGAELEVYAAGGSAEVRREAVQAVANYLEKGKITPSGSRLSIRELPVSMLDLFPGKSPLGARTPKNSRQSSVVSREGEKLSIVSPESALGYEDRRSRVRYLKDPERDSRNTAPPAGARLVVPASEPDFDALANALINETDPERKAAGTRDLVVHSKTIRDIMLREKDKMLRLYPDTTFDLRRGALSASVNLPTSRLMIYDPKFGLKFFDFDPLPENGLSFQEFFDMPIRVRSGSQTTTVRELFMSQGIGDLLQEDNFILERNINFLYDRQNRELIYVIGQYPDHDSVYAGVHFSEELRGDWSHKVVQVALSFIKEHFGIHYHSDIQFLFHMHYHPLTGYRALGLSLADKMNFLKHPYLPGVIVNLDGAAAIYAARMNDPAAQSRPRVLNETPSQDYFAFREIRDLHSPGLPEDVTETILESREKQRRRELFFWLLEILNRRYWLIQDEQNGYRDKEAFDYPKSGDRYKDAPSWERVRSWTDEAFARRKGYIPGIVRDRVSKNYLAGMTRDEKERMFSLLDRLGFSADLGDVMKNHWPAGARAPRRGSGQAPQESREAKESSIVSPESPVDRDDRAAGKVGGVDENNVAAFLPSDAKAGFFKRLYRLLAAGLRQGSRGQTLTSTSSRRTSLWGMGWWSSLSDSIYNSMASLAFLRHSSTDSPSVTHPRNAGTDTAYPPEGSFSNRILKVLSISRRLLHVFNNNTPRKWSSQGVGKQLRPAMDHGPSTVDQPPVAGSRVGETIEGTNFVLGGPNDTKAIASLRKWAEYHNRLRAMRPGGATRAGFLGPQEDLADLIIRDAETLKRLGVSQAQLADWLDAVVAGGTGNVVPVNGQEIEVVFRDDPTEVRGPPLPGVPESLHNLILRNRISGYKLPAAVTEAHPALVRLYGFFHGAALNAIPDAEWNDQDPDIRALFRQNYGETNPAYRASPEELLKLFTGKRFLHESSHDEIKSQVRASGITGGKAGVVALRLNQEKGKRDNSSLVRYEEFEKLCATQLSLKPQQISSLASRFILYDVPLSAAQLKPLTRAEEVARRIEVLFRGAYSDSWKFYQSEMGRTSRIAFPLWAAQYLAHYFDVKDRTVDAGAIFDSDPDRDKLLEARGDAAELAGMHRLPVKAIRKMLEDKHAALRRLSLDLIRMAQRSKEFEELVLEYRRLKGLAGSGSRTAKPVHGLQSIVHGKVPSTIDRGLSTGGEAANGARVVRIGAPELPLKKLSAVVIFTERQGLDKQKVLKSAELRIKKHFTSALETANARLEVSVEAIKGSDAIRLRLGPDAPPVHLLVIPDSYRRPRSTFYPVIQKFSSSHTDAQIVREITGISVKSARKVLLANGIEPSKEAGALKPGSMPFARAFGEQDEKELVNVVRKDLQDLLAFPLVSVVSVASIIDHEAGVLKRRGFDADRDRLRRLIEPVVSKEMARRPDLYKQDPRNKDLYHRQKPHGARTPLERGRAHAFGSWLAELVRRGVSAAVHWAARYWRSREEERPGSAEEALPRAEEPGQDPFQALADGFIREMAQKGKALGAMARRAKTQDAALSLVQAIVDEARNRSDQLIREHGLTDDQANELQGYAEMAVSDIRAVLEAQADELVLAGWEGDEALGSLEKRYDAVRALFGGPSDEGVDEAVSAFRQAVESSPVSTEHKERLLTRLGNDRSAWRQERWKQINRSRQAERAKGDAGADIRKALGRAKALLLERRYGEAFEIYDALVRDPRTGQPYLSQAYLGAAKAESNRKKYEAALEYLEAGLDADPDNLFLKGERAWQLYYAGRFRDAIEQSDAMLQADPLNTVAVNVRIGSMIQSARTADDLTRVRSAIEWAEKLLPEKQLARFRELVNTREAKAKRHKRPSSGARTPMTEKERRIYAEAIQPDLEQIGIERWRIFNLSDGEHTAETLVRLHKKPPVYGAFLAYLGRRIEHDGINALYIHPEATVNAIEVALASGNSGLYLKTDITRGRDVTLDLNPGKILDPYPIPSTADEAREIFREMTTAGDDLLADFTGRFDEAVRQGRVPKEIISAFVNTPPLRFRIKLAADSSPDLARNWERLRQTLLAHFGSVRQSMEYNFALYLWRLMVLEKSFERETEIEDQRVKVTIHQAKLLSLHPYVQDVAEFIENQLAGISDVEEVPDELADKVVDITETFFGQYSKIDRDAAKEIIIALADDLYGDTDTARGAGARIVEAKDSERLPFDRLRTIPSKPASGGRVEGLLRPSEDLGPRNDQRLLPEGSRLPKLLDNVVAEVLAENPIVIAAEAHAPELPENFYLARVELRNSSSGLQVLNPKTKVFETIPFDRARVVTVKRDEALQKKHVDSETALERNALGRDTAISKGLFTALVEAVQQGRKPGGVVVGLDDLAPDAVTFEGNLLAVRVLQQFLSRLGVQVSVEGRPDLEKMAEAAGMTLYSNVQKSDLKWIVMGTKARLEARGLSAGEGEYVIQPQAAGEVRAIRAEMFAAALLSTVRKAGDAVDERLVRFTAGATGSDQGLVRSILEKLALGSADEGLLAAAERHTALPTVMKIPIGKFLEMMRKVAAEMTSWA